MRITLGDTELVLRPIRERDEPYVMGTWLNSYAEATKGTGRSKADYFRSQRMLCRELLRFVFAAVSDDDDDTIHAWVCGQRGRLHYAYVPLVMRSTDIGVRMIEAVCGEGPLEVTHKLPFMAKGWTYNPYAIGVVA